MTTNLSMKLVDSPWKDTIEVGLFAERTDGTVAFAENITLRTVEPGQFAAPVFELSREQAQEVFNQLWHQGFRPKDGTGNGGHLEAIKYHLEDMRRIVFGASK